MASLKQKTVSGMKWQLINKIAQKVISVGTFAVLARMLEPSNFGLFALAFVLIDGLGLFEGLGLDAGVVQSRNKDENMLHTAFWMMVAQGSVVCIGCYFSAPYVGKFFNNAEVVPVIRALSFIFILSSITRVPKALLTKTMQFNRLAMSQLIAAIVNSTVAIGLAFVFRNVWCLVWAYWLKQLTITLYFWWWSEYKFKFQFDRECAKELVKYGKYLAGVSIIWYIGSQLSNIVVGKLLGVTLLGYYALASNIGNFINTHFVQMLSTVLFPAYATLQHDKEELKRVFLKTTGYVAIFAFPFAALLVTVSQEFVNFLYGPKWSEIVPLIQWYGVMELSLPFTASVASLFNACGKSKYSFILNLITISVRFPLIIFMVHHWGMLGAVLSELLVRMLSTPILLYFSHKLIGVTPWEQVKIFKVPLVCSVLMIGAILLFKSVILGHHFLAGNFSSFASLVAVSLSSYAACFMLFDRLTANELRKMIFHAKS